jgi:hypothetical protein
MTINDLYELRLFQHSASDNIDIVQVFHYQQTAGAAGAASDQLTATFLANVVPKIRDIQNSDVTNELIECINYQNDADFTTDVITGSAGLATGYGDPLPSFIVSSFILTRTTRALRNGHKRFSGLSEGMVNVRNLSGAVLTNAGTLAAVLGQVLPASSYQFTPIIYGKPIPDRPGKPSPRTEPVWCTVGSAAFQGVSTQNTRKR